MAQKNLSQFLRLHLKLLAVLLLLTGSNALALDVKSDCPSIEVISVVVHEVQEPGAPWASNEINLVLKNNGQPLLGLTYLFNKQLELDTYGAGTLNGMEAPLDRKNKILPGRTFQEFIVQPLETQTVNISAALFEGDKWEGDPYVAESMRAKRAGMDARARQAIGVLKSNAPDSQLSQRIQALPDIPAPKKFSEHGRHAFDRGTETGKQSILQFIEQHVERADLTKKLEEVLP